MKSKGASRALHAGAAIAVVVLVAPFTVPAHAATIECARAGTCFGTPDSDRLLGTGGPDDVRARAGADVLLGKSGRDVLDAGTGTDGVKGGRGPDTLYAGPVGDTRQEEFGDSLRGGRGHDVLHAGVQDLLFGGAGPDVMYGGRKLQRFVGGAGDDVMQGRDGRDYYIFDGSWGHDVIVDTPHANPRGVGNLLWISQVVEDLTIDLRSNSESPEVSTPDGSSTIDWADDAITHVILGHGDDTIHGNALPNNVTTTASDTVYGHEGRDYLQGGSSGTVTIFAGEDDDVVSVWDEDDGFPDYVDCGPGEADEVTYDPDDTVVNCEILHEGP